MTLSHASASAVAQELASLEVLEEGLRKQAEKAREVARDLTNKGGLVTWERSAVAAIAASIDARANRIAQVRKAIGAATDPELEDTHPGIGATRCPVCGRPCRACRGDG